MKKNAAIAGVLLGLSGLSGTAFATTISNLRLSAQSGTSATLTWTTDVPASTQIWYGVGTPSSQTPRDPTLATSHTVTLTGVANNSTYSYYAISVDGSHNSATSATQQFLVCTGAGPNNGLTNVQGTVNNYYEYGLYAFVWVAPAGFAGSPTLCGNPLTTTYTGNLDGGASVSRQIPDTTQIVPSPSQWQVTVTGINGVIGSFQIAQAITPKGNNLTAALQAGAAGNLIHVWYDPNTGIYYPPSGGGGTISGSGTANFLPIWTAATVLGNSPIFTDGTGLAALTLPFTSTINLNAPQVNVNGAAGAAGAVAFAQGTGAGASANSVTVEAPASVPTGYAINLPAGQGGGALTNDGSGNTAWSATDIGNYIDNEGYIESNGSLEAQYGCLTMGDSNSAGAGLPPGKSWAQLFCAALNVANGVTSPYNNIGITVPGDVSADNANRAFNGFSPDTNYNQVLANQYNTNNIDSESDATPIFAHQLAFTSQTAAAGVHVATAATEKYLPTAQQVVQTGQNVVLNGNLATFTVTQKYRPAQRLLVNNCTTLISLNGSWVKVLGNPVPTGTAFTVSYPNSNAQRTITGETCSFTPSNIFLMDSSWIPLEVFPTVGYTTGSSQGIFYQEGNVLTFTCSTTNAIFHVGHAPSAQIPYTSIIDGHAFLATVVVSGGIVTSVTLANPDSDPGGPSQGFNYVQIGNSQAIGQGTGRQGNYNVIAVNLIAGGTSYPGGDGTYTNVPLYFNGALASTPIIPVQFGSGCPQNANPSLTMSCTLGTNPSTGLPNTACGQFATFSYSGGVQLEVSTAGTATMSIDNIVIDKSPDLWMIYAAGPNFGGVLRVSEDGGPALVGDIQNTSAISTSFGTDGYRYGPTNYGGTTALQAEHFVLTSVAQTATTNDGGTGYGPDGVYNITAIGGSCTTAPIVQATVLLGVIQVAPVLTNVGAGCLTAPVVPLTSLGAGTGGVITIALQSAHVITITGTNTGGSAVAIAEIVTPHSYRGVGANSPNVVMGGAIPNQNYSVPKCGLNIAAGCQYVYSNWLSALVAKIAKTGVNAKYYSNLNVPGIKGYLQTEQSAVVTAAGSGYTNGTYELPTTGGGFTTQPTVIATVVGGALVVSTIGTYGLGGTSAATVNLGPLGAGTGAAITFTLSMIGNQTPLIANCQANSTNGLHMDDCAHQIVANNALSAAKATPAPMPYSYLPQGVYFFQNNQTPGGSFVAGEFMNPGDTIPGSMASQALIHVVPTAYSETFCDSNTGSGQYWIFPITAAGQQYNCSWEFNFPTTGSGILHDIPMALGNLQGSTSHQFERDNYVANTGVYQITQTTGTGYTGAAPVITWSTGDGNCTTYPVATAQIVSGNVSAAIKNPGICPGPGVPTPTLSGVTPGAGTTWSWNLGLAGAVAISAQLPGLGYTGSPTLTSSGGNCVVGQQPTFTAALNGTGGVVVTQATPGDCPVPPTAFALGGVSGGSGFSITFGLAASNTATQLVRWISRNSINNSVEQVVHPGSFNWVYTSVPQKQFLGPNGQQGIMLRPGVNSSSNMMIFDADLLTTTVTGVPMFALTTTGVMGVPSFTQGTGVLNIPSATSAAITSATGGTGVSAVTCVTASCTNLTGTYSMTATSVTAGVVLTLVWPTTTTAYNCLAAQSDSGTYKQMTHSVATATGMTVSVGVAVASGTIQLDYECRKP